MAIGVNSCVQFCHTAFDTVIACLATLMYTQLQVYATYLTESVSKWRPGSREHIFRLIALCVRSTTSSLSLFHHMVSLHCSCMRLSWYLHLVDCLLPGTEAGKVFSYSSSSSSCSSHSSCLVVLAIFVSVPKFCFAVRTHSIGICTIVWCVCVLSSASCCFSSTRISMLQ